MLYSDKVFDHFSNPRNVGEIENADGVGEVGNAKCGDIMKMYIKVDNGIISDVKFKTFGCGAAVATSSMATELIKGKSIDDALKLTNKAVVEALDGLPPVKLHCSVLAEQAIKAALSDYYKKQGKDLIDVLNELYAKHGTFKETQIALSNTKILRQNYIDKLSQEEQDLQAKIDEYNNQINQVEAEIRKLALTVSFGEDYRGGPMQWPINGHYTITSNYGMRVHPITGVYKLHTGVDISATTGDDFTAMADGIVVKAEYNSAYGNMVIIDHGGGVQTLYAHGSQIIAQVGQEVKAGDIVLKVGSTGYSTGPHAHFEVRVNGSPVNPLDYVTKPE